MYIIVDSSTDQTYELLASYIKRYHLEDRVFLYQNQERHGACHNIDAAIRGYPFQHAIADRSERYTIPECPDHDVVIIYDGDDTLAHTDVLSYLAQVYSDQNIWLTYGQNSLWSNPLKPGDSRPLSKAIMDNATFRVSPCTVSHLRTFRSWLYKLIKPEDLIYNHRYYQSAADSAIMYPMLEMASKGHILFIPEVLLHYNDTNPLSDSRVDPILQSRTDRYIKSLPCYLPIQSPA
jgi:hypothetical protein